MSPAPVRAGGGVLWRGAGATVEVALVHRPRYDDWSLPKGKSGPGEPQLLTAVREVAEETGHRGVVGRPLGVQRYLKSVEGGGTEPKTVAFWAMEVVAGRFEASAEVDRLDWLAPAAAADRLTMPRDRETLHVFARGPLHTSAVAYVRHARAGERSRWSGPDDQRPLDPTGHAQAEALSPLLGCYGFERVHSADVLRCLDTVAPFAKAQGLPVESEPLVSESGYAAAPDQALARCLDITRAGPRAVVCSQGRVLPELLARLCERLGGPHPGHTSIAKGGFRVLHVVRGALLATELLAPPA